MFFSRLKIIAKHDTFVCQHRREAIFHDRPSIFGNRFSKNNVQRYRRIPIVRNNKKKKSIYELLLYYTKSTHRFRTLRKKIKIINIIEKSTSTRPFSPVYLCGYNFDVNHFVRALTYRMQLELNLTILIISTCFTM